MTISKNIKSLTLELTPAVTLVAISKTKPESMILEAYNAKQLDFGENKVQDLVEKYEHLPKDIRWHFIGHLQTNKVKYIAPFIHLIHAVDSMKLLKKINFEAQKAKRTIHCLLQLKIATEESKFGLSETDASALLGSQEFKELNHISIDGLMGMASYSDDTSQIEQEFATLKHVFQEFKTNYFAKNESFKTLSMGMSGDYKLAIKNGSNMVRIGSTIFGERHY